MLWSSHSSWLPPRHSWHFIMGQRDPYKLVWFLVLSHFHLFSFYHAGVEPRASCSPQAMSPACTFPLGSTLQKLPMPLLYIHRPQHPRPPGTSQGFILGSMCWMTIKTALRNRRAHSGITDSSVRLFF